MADLFEKYTGRDAAELLGEEVPQPIRYESHREFVREVLREEVDFRAQGKEIVEKEPAKGPSIDYRKYANSEGSPSETVAAGYVWRPGTELSGSRVIERLAPQSARRAHAAGGRA